MGRDFLPRIMEIDRICYEQEYVGELSKMEARYDRNPRSFVCVMDGEKPAGYINFFPVGEALWEEIVETRGYSLRQTIISGRMRWRIIPGRRRTICLSFPWRCCRNTGGTRK